MRFRNDVFLQYKVLWDGEDPNSIQTETVAAFADLPPAFSLDLPPYKGIRTPNYLFVEWPMKMNGTVVYEYEAYNMRTDPYQLSNIANTMPPAVFNMLMTRLYALANCVGESCI